MSAAISLADQRELPIARLSFSPDPPSGAPQVVVSLRSAGETWGEGPAIANRQRVLESIGADGRRLYGLSQIHSRTVLRAEELAVSVFESEERAPQGDGLISRDREQLLAVRVADCYPIFLFDRQSGAIGVVHSGWRGTGIAVEALRQMTRHYGTRAREVMAIVGPGIGPCCYNVPKERAEGFEREFGRGAVQYREDTAYLDLRSTNRRLLEEAGVDSVSVVNDCTQCSPYLGSFRREGQEFTHMLALIGYLR